ncbi:MAG: hypothetical protein EXX96DRAFT_607877 [Benjaminiella poitrasii]|nr:MAG: hypothetical protein EXX96DRAFT_607877 [Benjaminiella poitrasii]
MAIILRKLLHESELIELVLRPGHYLSLARVFSNTITSVFFFFTTNFSLGLYLIINIGILPLLFLLFNNLSDNFTRFTRLSSKLIPTISFFVVGFLKHVIERKVINDIAEKYCYQLICQGTSEWTNTANDLNIQDIRQRIISFCLPLRDLPNIRATLVTLFQSPDKTIPLLLFLLAELEQDYKNSTPYDVRRLLLPRLSSMLPSPTYHWRFITISANALSAFLPRQSLPRGYVDQL